MPNTENNKNLKLFFNNEYVSLKAYVHSKIKDTTDRDAEDIIQEVALKLFSRTDNSSPITNITSFVYRAIKNKIIDTMRTKTKRMSFEEQTELKLLEFSELFYENSSDIYSDTIKIELKKAISNLKPEYQSILIAVDFEGYNYKEIANETGIPIGTLMSRRHRALSILAKKLETKRHIN
ncbi:RNA polymerase ECF family sigma subunit [Maribacter vaceletii]|uniref:RNA polymerase ECF family sigma subunit n=1 Tax=Maribacter vaceletii TaxID=1206816 RepID=A0A495ECJ0_9FLAO|nr:RNA polymerase sigma factor [Maribacter vaceletii]RKR14590.1 RNA polymerase ECF family sigma subunit [Maribacter vaceletii]